MLRYLEPDRDRPFRAPLSPFVPVAAIVSCTFLMTRLPTVTWIRFGIWLANGIAIYFVNGYRKSRLRAARQ